MSDLFGSIVDFGSNIYQEQAAKRRQDDQQAFTAEQASNAQAFEERMSNTAIQRRSTDLAAAGFNPLLAVANNSSGATTPMGHAGSGGIASAPAFHPMSQSLASAAQASLAERQTALIDAQEEKTKAEAENIRAQTPVHAVSMDQMRQQIDQSKYLIEKMIAETSHSYFSAINVQAQTRQLDELVPQIRATVDNLKASTRLHGAQTSLAGAQTQLAGAQTGKTVTETGEISQRIEANLPALEAALKTLEGIKLRAMEPGWANDRVAQESAHGAIGAALRAINPLSDFFKAR